MTARDVAEVVLAPMLATYPAPHHLRNDPEAREAALNVYLHSLERFDRRTLAQAWRKVTSEHTYWAWPVPGRIAEACRLLAQPAPESADSARRRQATQMSEAYASRYMKTSKLAKLARAEGWAGQLRYYVAAAAWVQAQLICGVENVSWEAYHLTKPERFQSSAEALAAYLPRIEGPVSRGEVLVRVPSCRIRAWKAEAQAGREASPSRRHVDRAPPPSRGAGRGG